MYAFLVFILIILGIYLFYNPVSATSIKTKEGFESQQTLPPIEPAEPKGVNVEQPWAYSKVNAPVRATVPKIDPPPVRNKGQDPLSSDLPGEVPGAPYLQIARNDPRPYEDPTLVKTTVQRIKEVQERLKGFLAFQAQLLSDRSDPQIQMPLSSARADFERLKSTLNVLSRNPDMQPTQTQQQMDEIDDNLAYLQREAEKVQALSPGQEMPAPLKPSVFEGFEDPSAASPALLAPPSSQPPQPSQPSNYSLPSTVSNTGLNDYTISSADQASKNSDRASLKDLEEFHARVTVEQKRLSRSGTTDPLIQARIAGLDRIQGDIEDIQNRIRNKQMREDEIPIKKSEIKNALKIIKDGGVPGPLSSNAANSLPGQAVDTALSQTMPGIDSMPKAALKRFMDKVHVTFGINYTDSVGGIMQSYGIPGVDEVNAAPANHAPPLPNPATNETFVAQLYESKTRHAIDGNTLATYTGFTEEECKKSCDDEPDCDGYNYRWGNNLNPRCTLRQGSATFHTDLYTDAGLKKKSQTASSAQGFQDMESSPAPYSVSSGNTNASQDLSSKAPFPKRTTDWVYNGGQAVALGSVGGFDWKDRSKQIVDQIRKRGMNPRDFGALAEGASVSADFDWKGYTHMICSRLEASFDTGMSVASGCPSHDWNGWQIPSRS